MTLRELLKACNGLFSIESKCAEAAPDDREWIADALAKGIDGVILLGCRKGDDYQCHFIKGSELANTRMEKISETLGRLALEPDRVRVEEIGIMDVDRLPRLLKEFMDRIKEMEPKPYKGFSK